MLSELDDRLSTIRRWSILRTITTQSVAEHCFNTQRITMRIARVLKITDWQHLYRLSQAALHHDDEEAIFGDRPAPAKGYVTEDQIDVGGQAWYDGADEQTRAIVKLADIMEALHFLTLEMHMGNKYVIVHRTEMIPLIRAHLVKHKFPDELQAAVATWIKDLETTVSQKFERGKDGPNARPRGSPTERPG